MHFGVLCCDVVLCSLCCSISSGSRSIFLKGDCAVELLPPNRGDPSSGEHTATDAAQQAQHQFEFGAGSLSIDRQFLDSKKVA